MVNLAKKNKVVVILGPTSSGKSDVAIFLAKRFGGEVISADSRQVYKGMDLGTGKVEGSWKKIGAKKYFFSEGIVHHLIDFRSPRGEYNVSHFQKDCARLIDEICSRKKLPIICGGTGFWISAVVDGISLPKVEPDPILRKRLGEKTSKQLFAQLEKLDPTRAKTIDKQNKVRLIRAIEICKALGFVPKPKSRKLEIGNWKFLQIGIDHKQEVLDQKIKKRLESRWTSGMLREVQVLRNKYHLSWKKIQSFGLGYFWIPEYLRGKIGKEHLKDKVFQAERSYAKRQRTWFKKDQRIFWENNNEKIKKLAKNFLVK